MSITDDLIAFLQSQGYSLARAQQMVAEDADAVAALQAGVTEIEQDEVADVSEQVAAAVETTAEKIEEEQIHNDTQKKKVDSE